MEARRQEKHKIILRELKDRSRTTRRQKYIVQLRYAVGKLCLVKWQTISDLNLHGLKGHKTTKESRLAKAISLVWKNSYLVFSCTVNCISFLTK